MIHPQDSIQLYTTELQECGYLPGRESRNLLIDPQVTLTPALYEQLVLLGFRRTGELVYRPHCPSCSQCMSLRVDTRRFKPSRSQRRNWDRHCTLQVARCPPILSDEQFELYLRYLNARHGDGEMVNMSKIETQSFFSAIWSDSQFIDFRISDRLIMTAVIDHLPHGMSAVYTFFDPDHRPSGLGTYAILWQIEECRHLHRPWLYLGYWIQGCAKMNYKSKFTPNETLDGKLWGPLPDDARQ